jgi:paired amphipathic helix protein Sin3a
MLQSGYDDTKESALMKKNRTNYYAYTMDMDATACKMVTPSYRELPADVPLTPCSGRTELCDSVLNDRYVSLSSGQEDSGSFKVTRKNQYEEALFRCEDERYELDMVIETNASTLRYLEQLDEQMRSLNDEAAAQRFRLPAPLDMVHVRSLARVYGEPSTEVIEMLKTSPWCSVCVCLIP